MFSKMPLLWYQFQNLKNHLILNSCFLVCIILSALTNLTLTNLLLYIFIIALSYEMFFSIKKIFNFDNQISAVWPFDAQKLLVKYVSSIYIKMFIFLFLGFLIKFSNIKDLFMLLVICLLFYTVTLLTSLLRLIFKPFHFMLIFNAYGILLFLFFIFIGNFNLLLQIFFITLPILVNYLLTKILLNKVSFEKIIEE